MRRFGQTRHLGPGRLGVDMVDRDRGDTAPVVDPCVEKPWKIVVGQIRRRLDVPFGAEDDPSDRDRPEVLLEGRLGMRRHPRPRLRAEVLDDHLLDVPVLLAQRSQGEQCVDPLLPCLADPDQDPAREGDPELAGKPDRLEATGGDLVGRRPVRAAPPPQPLGRRLEHDPHRGADRPQELELRPVHHPRVQVREKPSFLEDEVRAPGEVLDGRLAAEPGELLAGHLVAELRPVSEREERLAAPCLGARTSDLEHLVLGQERPLASPRRPRERAVAADVTAELRERNEDLRRVRDERPGS